MSVARGVLTVRVYVGGELVGEDTCESGEVVYAAGAIMAKHKVNHCAVRFEDENGSGGWMLVGGQGGTEPQADDLPIWKKRRGTA